MIRARTILLAVALLASGACESRVTLDGDVQGPSELSATALRSRIQLTWNGVEGAEYYEVFQGNTAGTSPEVYTRLLTSTVSELSVQQVIPGTTYHFVVTAMIDGVRSLPTGEVSTAALEDSPVSTTPATTLQGEFDSRFGAAIAFAGDLNADGRGDLVVGSPAWVQVLFEPPIGRADVFFGEEGGLDGDPVFTIAGKQTNGGFGSTVLGVPDVNFDGFADVLVSEPNGFFDQSGRVYAYYGSDEGTLGTGPTGCFPNGNTECAFLYASDFFANQGTALGMFEDLTGDGRPEIFSGSPFASVSTAGGLVELTEISPFGSTVFPPNFSYRSTDAGDAFGASVASDRDVNGDGVPDAIAGAPLRDNGHGRVALFLANGGTLEGPVWTADGGADGDGLGMHVALADLDCDSIADVVAGVPGGDDLGVNAGRVEIFHGGNIPLSATPDEVLLGLIAGEGFGVVSSVGDVDGDGCDDLLVGSPSFDGVFIDEGRAQIFRGGSEGISTEPVWTDFGRFPGARFGEALAGGGDFDGDSFLDIAVGAPEYDSAGQVLAYRGLAASGPRVSAGLPARVAAGSPLKPQLAGFSDPTTAQSFTCVWSWDDGESGTQITPCTPLDAGDVAHVWRDPGVYRVRLTVIRNDGVIGEAVSTVTVE